jgi:hypothetical protein
MTRRGFDVAALGAVARKVGAVYNIPRPVLVVHGQVSAAVVVVVVLL